MVNCVWTSQVMKSMLLAEAVQYIFRIVFIVSEFFLLRPMTYFNLIFTTWYFLSLTFWIWGNPGKYICIFPTDFFRRFSNSILTLSYCQHMCAKDLLLSHHEEIVSIYWDAHLIRRKCPPAFSFVVLNQLELPTPLHVSGNLSVIAIPTQGLSP